MGLLSGWWCWWFRFWYSDISQPFRPYIYNNHDLTWTQLPMDNSCHLLSYLLWLTVRAASTCSLIAVYSVTVKLAASYSMGPERKEGRTIAWTGSGSECKFTNVQRAVCELYPKVLTDSDCTCVALPLFQLCPCSHDRLWRFPSSWKIIQRCWHCSVYTSYPRNIHHPYTQDHSNQYDGPQTNLHQVLVA